jgi:hypothetical protein
LTLEEDFEKDIAFEFFNTWRLIRICVSE